MGKLTYWSEVINFLVVFIYDRKFHFFFLRIIKMSHPNNVTWNVAYHLLTTYIAFNASKKIHSFHLLTILTSSRFRF